MPILPGKHFRQLSRRRFRFHYRLPSHGLPFLAEVRLQLRGQPPLHSHPYWQCLIPYRALRYRRQHDEQDASAGELLRFPPDSAHALMSDLPQTLMFLDIRIAPDSLLAASIAALPRQRLFLDVERLESHAMVMAAAGGLPTAQRTIRLMAQIWQLLDLLTGESISNRTVSVQQVDARLAALDDLLRYWPQQRITVADMAAHVNLSCSQLNRLCRQHLGVSPLQRLLYWRIQLACELLSTTQTDIMHIAHQSGFGSVDHFRRCFRKITGQLPSDWRQHQQL
jgi:AraC-like DNA-binding protein